MSQKQPIDIPYIDYTRLITCILYEGGASKVMELLHHKGLNEAYFYSVRGNPIGRASLAGNLPEIPKTEIVHVVVSADQADYLYNMLYEECDMKNQGKGVIYVNRLARSSRIALPAEAEAEAA
jgi:nitrogen regulatory protein PII